MKTPSFSPQHPICYERLLEQQGNKAPRRKQRGINRALTIRWLSTSLRPKGRGIKPAEIKKRKILLNAPMRYLPVQISRERQGLGAGWCLPALFPTIISRYDMLAAAFIKTVL
jgi:hypothetical protein